MSVNGGNNGGSELRQLADACAKAAEYYCTNPNEAGPATVVDIYRVMSALANMIDCRINHQPLPRSHLH